jgi:hypothetical protein
MSEGHREARFGRFAMHADATNRKQQITRDLRQPRTGFARSCVDQKTAKNRFALSFFARLGAVKRQYKHRGT